MITTNLPSVSSLDATMVAFRRQRRLTRNAWVRSGYQPAERPTVPPEPSEVVTLPDMLDDSRYSNCAECGVHDYVAMFEHGYCSACIYAQAVDWQLTVESIGRVVAARMAR